MALPTKPPDPEIADEPGMTERFQRTLRNLLNTPPKPRKTNMLNRKRAAPRKKEEDD